MFTTHSLRETIPDKSSYKIVPTFLLSTTNVTCIRKGWFFLREIWRILLQTSDPCHLGNGRHKPADLLAFVRYSIWESTRWFWSLSRQFYVDSFSLKIALNSFSSLISYWKPQFNIGIISPVLDMICQIEAAKKLVWNCWCSNSGFNNITIHKEHQGNKFLGNKPSEMAMKKSSGRVMRYILSKMLRKCSLPLTVNC